MKKMMNKKGFVWNDMIVYIALAMLALVIGVIVVGYFMGYGFNSIEFLKNLWRFGGK